MATRTYHWIMTAADGKKKATADGLLGLLPGSSRRAAYTWARAFMAQQLGSEDVDVLFFDLQPEELA